MSNSPHSRELRGGSWLNPQTDARALANYHFVPDARHLVCGVRVALLRVSRGIRGGSWGHSRSLARAHKVARGVNDSNFRGDGIGARMTLSTMAVRGGSWSYPQNFARVIARDREIPHYRDLAWGFRVSRHD